MKPGDTRGEGFAMEEFIREMRQQGSDSFSMTIERKPEHGRSISEDAVQQMRDVFTGFLGARLLAALDRNPEGHHTVTMELKLIINGESKGVGPDAYPWWGMLDGEHRRMH